MRAVDAVRRTLSWPAGAVAALTLVALVSPAPAWASAPSAPQPGPATLFVVEDLTADPPVVNEYAEGSSQLDTARAAARTNPGIHINPVVQYAPMLTPTAIPPYGDGGWAYARVGGAGAAAQGATGAGVTVALLDTSVAPNPDLAGKVDLAVDFIPGSAPNLWHGTEMAGVLVAADHPASGSHGISPGVRLISARVCANTCPNNAIIRAVIWSVQNGADVISMSLGGTALDPALVAVLEWAVSQNVFVAVAAGNSACTTTQWSTMNGIAAYRPNGWCNLTRAASSTSWPAAAPINGLMAVAAIDRTDAHASFSSYGPAVDIAAPGVSVATVSPFGYNNNVSGTSPATPFVAGAAALVRQVAPSLSPAQIQAVLEATADQPAQVSSFPIWDTCTWNQGDPTRYVWSDQTQWPWTCGTVVTDAIPPRHLVGVGILDVAAAVTLAREIEAGGRLAAPTVINGDTTADLSWEPVTGATGYDVLVDGGVEKTTSSATATVVGLTNLVSYPVTYRVHGGPFDGVVSAPSLVSPHPVSSLPTPVISRANVQSGYIRVFFDPALTGDVTATRTDTGEPLHISGYSYPVTEVDFDYPQDASSTVTLSLAQLSSDGASWSGSTEVTVVRPASQLPPVTNLHVTVATDGTAATATWDPQPGATGYQFLDLTTRTWVVTDQTSGEFSGLTPGSVYTATVYPRQGTTLGIPTSVTVAPLPPPLAPVTNIRAESVAGRSFTLVWDPVPEASSYNVYRSDGASMGSGVPGPLRVSLPAAGGSVTYYIVAYRFYGNPYSGFGVEGQFGEPFTYSFRAEQAIGFNALSDIAVGSPDQALTATATSTLPVSIASTSPQVCTVSGSELTGFSLHAVANGRCALVATQAGDVDIAPAPPVEVQVQVFDVPIVEHEPQVTAGVRSATVTWEPANARGATVTRYTVTATPGGRSCTVATSPCTVTGLNNGQPYTFTLVAHNRAGDSAPVSSDATPPTAPTAPRSLVVTVADARLDLSWSAPASDGGSTVSGYVVRLAPNDGSCSISGLGATCTGLTNGTTYAVSVAATNAAGDSSPVSSDGTARTVPTAPRSLFVTAADSQLDLSWSPPASDGGSAVSGYVVELTPGDGSCTVTDLEAVCTGLANGTSYAVSVAASNAAGDSDRATTSATPRMVPAEPRSLVATPGNARLGLTWIAPSTDGGAAVTGYTVALSPADGTCVVSGLAAACTGLTNGTAYTARVLARNAAGSSSAAEASATPRTVPGPPADVQVTHGYGFASLSWSAPSADGGAQLAGYDVSVTPFVEGCRTTVGVSPEPLRCTVFGLATGVRYTFAVTARNAAGASSGRTVARWQVFAGADLHGADLRDADLHSASLADADLSGALLMRADLRGADLQSTTFVGADLTGADLTGADVSDALWTGATCPDARAAAAHVGGTCPAPVDETAPTAGTTAPPYVAQPTITVSWTGTDTGTGVASYDVRVTAAAASGGAAGAPTTWRTATSLSSAVFTAVPGTVYCFSTRATDVAGNTGAWSGASCTTVAFDDRAFIAKGFVRATGRGWSGGTLSGAARTGATLSRTVLRTYRIGIVATTCPTCGSVSVWVGSTKVGTLSLKRSTTTSRAVLLLPRMAVPRTGVVRIVTGSPRLVRIDGVLTFPG